MSYLGIEEMDVVLSQMSTEEIDQLMTDLQQGYNSKRVRLGHALTEKEERQKRDDLLSDSVLYMKAMKELKDRYERQASEAWRKFDDEAEAYIEKMKQSISNKGIDD